MRDFLINTVVASSSILLFKTNLIIDNIAIGVIGILIFRITLHILAHIIKD